MKYRRNHKKQILTIILLLSILFFTIGYAALSSNLKISGTATVEMVGWDVHFENLNVTNGSIAAISEATIVSNGTLIEYEISLSKPGTYYEFTVDIVNDGVIDAMTSKVLRTGLTSNQEEFINYTVEYTLGNKVTPGDLLAAGERQEIKVRIELDKNIASEDYPSERIKLDLSFEIEYVQDDGEAKAVTSPVIMATDPATKTAFWSSTYKENIKTITFEEEINIPSNAVKSWDIGELQNGNVMAYIVANEEESTKYDLYIQGDGAIYANPMSLSLFENMKNLEKINNLNYLNTSNLTNMQQMFSGCYKLESLDVSNFNTSKVTNMSISFSGLQSITELDLSNFDTSNVTTMYNMFAGSTNLESINLKSFDTSKVTRMGQMFGATKLETIDLSNFDISNVTDMYYMFNGMINNTVTIIMNKTSFNNSVNTTGMFDTTTTYNIIVKTQNDKNFIDGLGYSNVTSIVG